MWNKRSYVFKKIWIHLKRKDTKKKKGKEKLFAAVAGMIIEGLL